MSKQKSTRIIFLLALAAVIILLSGCAAVPERTASNQAMDQVVSTASAPEETSDALPSRIDEVEIRSLEELLKADLIIEGEIVDKQTHWITDTTATNAELADRQARGLPIGTDVLEYQVAVDKVLHGQAPSATIVVTPHIATYEIGDRAILFLVDISGDPIEAPGQTKYAIMASAGQFRIEKDNTLFSIKRKGMNPFADTYRGKDKGVLEKDTLDLVAKLPKPAKEELLPTALSGYNGAELVIEGTIQGIQEVHFINSMEKPQEWIDQMLAEGKMPGLLLTDYTVTVDKVLFDKRADNPRFFPDWKPLEPGQTILVTRQGGTYRGVTKIEEPGPPFELGSREILFLSGFSLINYDVPDDGQVRYSTDSRRGRFLIGADGTLTAFTAQGLGGIYGGQDVGQLEQDIVEFLKTSPVNERIQIPPQP
ncbi:MAG TPA: hypothetical protein VFL17_22605 [Anaerolineae bacterium]|nr:hypothetical protein [Anaerolineae bacterium]